MPDDSAEAIRRDLEAEPRMVEEAVAEERARIRRELEAWLIGDRPREDAGLYNSRRIVDEINRICPEEPT